MLIKTQHDTISLFSLNTHKFHLATLSYDAYMILSIIKIELIPAILFDERYSHKHTKCSRT